MFVLVTGGSASGKSEYAEGLVLEGPESKSLVSGSPEPESQMPGSLGQKSDRVYLATMEPFGSEAAARIVRHRKLREGKGFETVECPVNIGACREICRGRQVLLEDLPNLVANEIFGAHAGHDVDEGFGPASESEADMGFGSDSESEADMGFGPASESEADMGFGSDSDPEVNTAYGSYTSLIRRVANQILELTAVSESFICVTGILTADGRKYDESTMGYLRTLACIEQTLAERADQVIEVVSGVANELKSSDSRVSDVGVSALKPRVSVTDIDAPKPMASVTDIEASNLRASVTDVDVSNLRQLSSENEDGTAREQRMVFVTGPMFSGKRKYIKSALGLDDENFGRVAVCDVQGMVGDASVSLESLAEELSEKEIVIADEIGCGVVPLDKTEREMRERAGRLACMLAERADAVVRVVCGCPQILKGENLLK